MSFPSPSRQAMLTADALDDLRGLARALVLGDRFSFHLVVAASPGATEYAISLLEKDEALVRKGLVVERYRPDLTIAPGLALRPAMETPRDHGVLVDLSFVVPNESTAFEAICANLNATRNAWAQNRETPLLVCVPDFAEGLFARTAPDLWSIRSSVSRLTVRPVRTDSAFTDDWLPSWLATPRTLEELEMDEQAASEFGDEGTQIELTRQQALLLAKNDPEAARALIDEAVEHLRRTSISSTYLLPRVLETRALLQKRTGDFDAACASVMEAVNLREAASEHASSGSELGQSLAFAAEVMIQSRRLLEAEDLARRALFVLGESSDVGVWFFSVPAFAILNSALMGKNDVSGALESARLWVRRCREKHEEHPSDRRAMFALAAGLLFLSTAEKLSGHLSEARERAVEASRLYVRLGPQASGGVDMAQRSLAQIDTLRGDYERARPTLVRQVETSIGQARAEPASVNALEKAAVATRDLGILDLARGAVDDGRRTLEESLGLFREIERVDGPSLAQVMALAALAASHEDDPREALRLFDEGFEIARKLGASPEVFEMLNEIRSKALATLPTSDNESPTKA